MQTSKKQIPYTIALVICGLGLSFLYYLIADECPKFEQGTSNKERPIISVLSNFGFAFAIYFVAWITVGGFRKIQQPRQRNNWIDTAVVFLFAIVFRCIITPTAPIQEIDLYRYVWDGAVFANGLDPYYFGPESVLRAASDSRLVETEPKLLEYVKLLESRPGLKSVVETIHYGTYTSPYPPVSQFFFGSSVLFVNKNAGKLAYIRAMKTMLVLFDLFSGALLAALLIHLGRNPTMCLAYLWCPLVIKEIANGGHLDSIATFFLVLSVYAATRAIWPSVRKTENSTDAKPNDSAAGLPRNSSFYSMLSAISLAAGFAAKVFPVVLFPIWLVVMMRSGLKSMLAVFVFAVSAYLFCFPMLKHLQIAHDLNLVSESVASKAEDADPSGIEAFSKYWEMNDFLFMLVVENLKPASGQIDYTRTPWFRFTSNDFRQSTIEKIQPYFAETDPSKPQLRPSNYAFFATRWFTLGVFCLIVLWACFNLLFQRDAERWLEMVFLVVAWFWLLSPTQNPWYWTWSLPFLAFARGRGWFFLSGLLFAYYLRFWFEYQYKTVDVINHWKTAYGDAWYYDWLFPFSDKFTYQGTRFFDYYVPVLEFGPWFVCLMVFAAIRLFRKRELSKSD